MRKVILVSLLIIGFVSAAAVPQARADWASLTVSSTTHNSSFEGSCFIDSATGAVELVGTTTLKDGTQIDVSASALIQPSGGKQSSWSLQGDVTTDNGTDVQSKNVGVTAKTFYSMVEKFATKVASISK